jgi:hypothetical protein
MRAAFPVLGCAAVLETYVVTSSVYGGCDELAALCLEIWFNGRFEMPLGYVDWGPCPLKSADEAPRVALYGST